MAVHPSLPQRAATSRRVASGDLVAVNVRYALSEVQHRTTAPRGPARFSVPFERSSYGSPHECTIHRPSNRHGPPQQIEIVQLLVTQDLTAERMAIHLGTTPSAINTQLDRLRHKLGVHSRVASVAKAWQAWMEMERESNVLLKVARESSVG